LEVDACKSPWVYALVAVTTSTRWIHAKAALRAVDVAEPGRCQRSLVLPGVVEVEDGDAAA
jgi:hypothetical protein